MTDITLVVAGTEQGGHTMPKVFAGRLRSILAVEVTGESMLPALRPGDLLLVRRGAGVSVGDLVVARHPRLPEQLIVKRIAYRTAEGWWLESDNQRAPGRQDSWDFDAVPERLLVGRPVARYWPPSRWSMWWRFRGPGAVSADGAVTGSTGR